MLKEIEKLKELEERKIDGIKEITHKTLEEIEIERVINIRKINAGLK